MERAGAGRWMILVRGTVVDGMIGTYTVTGFRPGGRTEQTGRVWVGDGTLIVKLGRFRWFTRRERASLVTGEGDAELDTSPGFTFDGPWIAIADDSRLPRGPTPSPRT